jgi:hypothetical protein
MGGVVRFGLGPGATVQRKCETVRRAPLLPNKAHAGGLIELTCRRGFLYHRAFLSRAQDSVVQPSLQWATLGIIYLFKVPSFPSVGRG